MKYARYDIILQEKEVNEDLLIRIDNSEASGAIPLELLSHDRKEKVSGYMNFQGAKLSDTTYQTRSCLTS